MKKRILLLIKVFGKEEYADKFIQQGMLRCQTIKQFKETKDDARGDPFEAVSDWHQPEDVSITITGTTPDGVSISRTLTDLIGPVVHQSHAYDGVKAYCMYSIWIPEFNESYEGEEERLMAVQKIDAMLKEHSTIADEMLSFGEHAVIIPRVSKFIERVKAAANTDGYESWANLVDYFDPDKFSGSFGEIEALFKKRKCYDYQREFRFIFTGDQSDEDFYLNLGSIEELAPIKIKTRDLKNIIQIRLDESKSKAQ